MAVDTFLKLAGIAGESDDARHKDEIDVLAWSWGVSEAHEGQTGAGASAGKPQDFLVISMKNVPVTSVNVEAAKKRIGRLNV